MKGRRFLGGVNIFVSVILSILLFCLTVVTPLYFSVTVFTKPQTVVKLVQSIDYKKVIEKNVVLVEALESFGVNATQVDKAIKSETAGKIIEVYADDAVDILMEIPTENMIDVPLIKELVNDNIDDVLNVVEENTDIKISKERVKNQVNTAIEKNEQIIEKVIPVIEPVRMVIKTVKASELLMNTLKPEFAAVLFATVFIIVLLILVLRRKKLGGFLWLAVNFLLSSAALLLVIIYSKSSIVKLIAEKISAFDTEVLISTISLSVERLNIGFAITVSLTMLCLMIYFIRLIYLKIKNNVPKSSDILGEVLAAE